MFKYAKKPENKQVLNHNYLWKSKLNIEKANLGDISSNGSDFYKSSYQ